MSADPYWRRCSVIRVIDGDTIDVLIDLGYYLTSIQRIRLLGVDTPELHSSDPGERATAQQAKEFCGDWLRGHDGHAGIRTWPLELRTEKADDFGRWLGVIVCPEGHSLVQALLESKLGRPYTGRKH